MKKCGKGFALIDAMIALFVASVVLVVLFGFISLGTKLTADIRNRVVDLILRKNMYEENREAVYSSE